MKFKEYIASHQASTTQDLYAVAAMEVAHTQLRRAVKSGEVERVRRGVYVSKTGKFTGEVPDPFLIVGTADSEAVISYHSALVAHGVAHNIGFECLFRSEKVRSPFKHGSVRYAPYNLDDNPQTQVMRSNSYGANQGNHARADFRRLFDIHGEGRRRGGDSAILLGISLS